MLEEKWKQDTLKPHRVTINDLTCRDCIHRRGTLLVCDAYTGGKPLKIISGSSECDKKEK